MDLNWIDIGKVAIGMGLTALGGALWSILRYRRDVTHNHSVDNRNWAQTIFDQMQYQQEFHEQKVKEYENRLMEQERKCQQEMQEIREENERCVAGMRERIEKLERQNHLIVKDVMANGQCIKPLDEQ